MEHVAVQRIDGGIVDVWLEHPLAQIVEHHDPRDPAQSAKGLLMQLRPRLRTGPEYQQANRLAAVAESQHEEPGAPVFAGLRVADHRAGAVVDLKFFAGGGFDYHARFRRAFSTELADESLDGLISAGEAVDIHQILPDCFGIAASGEAHFDGLLVGFAGADRKATIRFRFCFRRGPADRFFANLGGHLGFTGRFCRRGVGGHPAGQTGRFCPDPAAARWPQCDPGLLHIRGDRFSANTGFPFNPPQRPSQAP